MRTPEKIDAIRLLVGGGVSGSGDGSNTVYHEGQTPPTEEEIQAKLKELQDAYDAKQYQRDRNYPNIGEQLDMLYWDKKNDTKNWEDAIDKVKADNPKPE